MSRFERFLLLIARHGRIECRRCGTFNKKGEPCRCMASQVGEQ